jgi:hypothetical protein
MNKRANIFEDAAELDIDSFKPETASAPEPDLAKLKVISETSNFPSRQAKPLQAPTPIKREQRRHRTGRNVQLNIKATQAAIDEFNALCQEQNWVTGEALERMLAAIRREIGEGR